MGSLLKSLESYQEYYNKLILKNIVPALERMTKILKQYNLHGGNAVATNIAVQAMEIYDKMKPAIPIIPSITNPSTLKNLEIASKLNIPHIKSILNNSVSHKGVNLSEEIQ